MGKSSTRSKDSSGVHEGAVGSENIRNASIPHGKDQEGFTGDCANVSGKNRKKQQKRKENIQCPECDKVISSKDYLQTHIKQVHRREKPFACGICYKSFPQRTSLRVHLNIHSGEKPYKCTFCEKSFRGKSNLNRHIRIHTLEKPYTCKFCEKKFSDPGNLKVHLQYHTNAKNFVCEKCGKSFFQRTHLKHHSRVHLSSTDRTNESSFNCNICGQVYYKEGYLRRHLKGHMVSDNRIDVGNGVAPVDIQERSNFGQEAQDLSTEEDSGFQENSARDSINAETDLLNGIGISEPSVFQKESGSSLLNSTSREKSFDAIKETVIHAGTETKKLAKDRKQSFSATKVKCQLCGKILASRASLTMHLRIHLGEKRYSCNVCDKKFQQRTSLVVHQRIHKGEKPHACTECDKAFASRANLVRHLRIHTKEKPYCCQYCDKRFGESGNLKVHLRFHTNTKPFKCDVCEKTFYQYAHMKQHLKTHNKEKVFSCEICDKKFSRIGYLERHARGHEIVKQRKLHKCKICLKQLSRSTHLRRHMRVHEKDKELMSERSNKKSKIPSDSIKRNLENLTKVIEPTQRDDDDDDNRENVSDMSDDNAKDKEDADVAADANITQPTAQAPANVNQDNIQLNSFLQNTNLHNADAARIMLTQNFNAGLQEAYRVHGFAALFNGMQPTHGFPTTPALHNYADLLPQRSIQQLPSQRAITCETCGLEFSRPALLKKHRKTHTNALETTLQNFHTNSNGYDNQDLNNYNQFSHLPNLQQTYRCDVCNTSTNDVADLWTHFQVHSGQLRLLESKLTAHSL